MLSAPAAPSGADMIGRTDDWLRLVFTHEYTHIVRLFTSLRSHVRVAEARPVRSPPNSFFRTLTYL